MEKDLKITQDSYLQLINKVFENKIQERELALDRFRTADELMADDAERFIMMGKNAATFLGLASKSSDDMASLAKEIKSIVFKDSSQTDVNVKVSSDFKNSVSELLKEQEKKLDQNIDPEEE